MSCSKITEKIVILSEAKAQGSGKWYVLSRHPQDRKYLKGKAQRQVPVRMVKEDMKG